MSNFKLFHIDSDFEKVINEFTKNHEIIKWEVLPNKNIMHQIILLVEYQINRG